MNPRRAALLSAVALVFFGARAEASNALESVAFFEFRSICAKVLKIILK